jgi:hypothetical protein
MTRGMRSTTHLARRAKPTAAVLLLSLTAVLAVPAGAQTDSRSAFFLGNSLTAGMNPSGLLDELAAGRGDVWQTEQYTVPGAPLSWLWNKDHERTQLDGDGSVIQDVDASKIQPKVDTGTWDAVSLQPYTKPLIDDGAMSVDDPTLPDRRPGLNYDAGALRAAGRFTDMFRANNPGVDVYIYAHWPYNDGTESEPLDYQDKWDQPYTDPTSGGHDTRTRDFFEQFVEDLRDLKGQTAESKILMVPYGDVLYEIDRRMEAGQFGPFADVREFYRDGTHLMFGLPQYAKAATFYATIFGERPHGLDWTAYATIDSVPRADMSDEEKRAVFLTPDQASVELVNDAIWDVVAGHAYSGVVPEPASLGAFALALLTAARRRRR